MPPRSVELQDSVQNASPGKNGLSCSSVSINNVKKIYICDTVFYLLFESHSKAPASPLVLSDYPGYSTRIKAKNKK